MNIDVREYLRINPISVHELTLSGDGKDCFLYFPANENGTGYEVRTQNQMFAEIKAAVFQNLIDSNGKLRVQIQNGIVQWNNSIHLANTQFTRYVRRHVCDSTNPFPYVWNTIKTDIEARLAGLESGLSQKINDLRKNGVLNYVGAVELQSPRFDLDNVSSGFNLSNGFIWCHGKGKQILTGADEIELGSQTLKHSHADTKAEAMTISFARKKGGQIIGDYCVGNKIVVSSDTQFHIGQNIISQSFNPNPSWNFTYPLYGQNVLDWRVPKKTHNNIPPCYNIMVKYKPSTKSVELPAPEQRSSYPCMKVESRDDSQKSENTIEAAYFQSTVPELDSFTKSCFTNSDLLLRITSADSSDGNFHLMKQTIKDLLDIFVDVTEHDLAVTDGGRTYYLWELLMPKLDIELVPRYEFLHWYKTCMQRLDEINNKIKTINELIQSVPPLPYVGKIIISTTDDVESKVIKHYGGKRWRRIVNFLRGVNGNDETLGKKFGEEYVCLRESNIPIHTHSVQKRGVISEPPETQGNSSKAEWMCRKSGGSDKKTVSVDPNTAEKVNGISNCQMGYQISPLEYGSKDYATIPHNNMPPYREVYIWECIEITDYEKTLVGNPKEYSIVYIMNGGIKPEAALDKYTTSDLPYTPPDAEYEGNRYHFSGWSPERIHSNARSNFTLTAKWHCFVEFDANGGTLQGESIVRLDKGEKIGTFPEATPDSSEYGLEGWYDSPDGTGERYTEDSIPDGNVTLYAKWYQIVPPVRYYTVRFEGNKGTSDGRSVVSYENQPAGTEIVVPTFTRSGYVLQRWNPPVSNGRVTVAQNQTYVAIWTQSTFEARFNANGGTFSNGGTGDFIRTLAAGERLVSPSVEREYYDFTGWSPTVPETMPGQNVTYTAQWTKKRYKATFDANGGTGGGMFIQEWSTTLRIPANPTRPGYLFTTWNPAPPPTMPKQDTTYYAQWRENSYTITFDVAGGTLATTMKTGMKYRVPVGTLPEPSKPDNMFLGWFNPISSDPLEESTPYPFQSDSTYTAQWTRIVFTATFNANGGTPEVQTRRYTHLERFGNLPEVEFAGHTLKRWEMQDGSSSQTITPETAYNFLRDIICNAVWELDIYQINYNMNGHGAVPQNVKTSYTIEDVTYSPPQPDSVTGYTFTGWNPVSVPHGSTGDKEFSAIWQINRHTATFNANGGVGGTTKTQDYGTALYAPSVSRIGYTFEGWTPSVPSTMPDEDCTFTAQWQAIIYTITFDANGGSGGGTVQKGYGETVIIPETSRAGHVFAGWFTERTGGTKIVSPITVTEDATYYAHWEEDPIEVTYHANYPQNETITIRLHKNY